MNSAADSTDASALPQGAGAPPRAPAGGHEPWFTPTQIGERVGRGKRIVQLWMLEGLPSRPHPSKRGYRQAQMSAVRAYMAAKGLVQGIGAKSNAEAKTQARRTPAVAGAPTSGIPGPTSAAGDLYEKRISDEVERRLAEAMRLHTGSIDFAGTIAAARAAQEQLRKNPLSGEASIAEQDKYASAVERYARVVERLDKARFEAEERAKKWMERAEARRMVVSLGLLFASDLTSLAVDEGGEVVSSLLAAGYIVEGKADESRRVASVAARELVDNVRARRAEEIRRAVGILDAEGGSDG